MCMAQYKVTRMSLTDSKDISLDHFVPILLEYNYLWETKTT